MPIPSDTLDIPASAGKVWVETFRDDFDGTTINKTKWRGGYSQLLWCGIPKGSCPDQYTGLSVSNSILQLQPKLTPSRSTDYQYRAMMHTGGLNATDARFSQKYGYFEASMKYPKNDLGQASGMWFSFWALPLEKTDNTHSLGANNQQEEVDIMESWINAGSMSYTQFGIHDVIRRNHELDYPNPRIGNLSNDYHRYGLYWRDDGSEMGSMQSYFDGRPQGTPFVLQSGSKYWKKGIYLIIQAIPCWINNAGTAPCTSQSTGTSPVFVDYIRAFKECPANSPIPTVDFSIEVI